VIGIDDVFGDLRKPLGVDRHRTSFQDDLHLICPTIFRSITT
jgi:hypothetical protein